MNKGTIEEIEQIIKEIGLSSKSVTTKSANDPSEVTMIDLFTKRLLPIFRRKVVGKMTFNQERWNIWVSDMIYVEQIMQLHKALLAEFETKFGVEIYITAEKT